MKNVFLLKKRNYFAGGDANLRNVSTPFIGRPSDFMTDDLIGQFNER